MNKDSEFSKPLFILIIFSILVRVFLAFSLELGNDEAYYWTYALFPDFSHFDQPPMVGWLIQLFTLNLYFSSEFFIRLAAIIFGTVNTWLIFVIGRRLKNKLAGFYAALLYTSSPYFFIVSGTFMIPDSALSFFYLISVFFLLEGIFSKYGLNRESISLSRLASIITGVFIGLALLTKFSAVFLWIGVLIYILIKDRKLLKNPLLYLSAVISFLFIIPMIIWGIKNNFVNYDIYSRSINLSDGINFTSFLKNIGGLVLYNNPINVIIIIIALISYKKRSYLDSKHFVFLLSISIPLILTYMVISLYRPTLPHLSSPGFFGLIIIASAWLSDKEAYRIKLVPKAIKYSIVLMIIAVIAGFLHIKTGLLEISFQNNSPQLGKNDVTLDMYGWKQLSKKFEKIRNEDIEKGIMNKHSNILSQKWYIAAHLDYYIASRNSIEVKTISSVQNAHKYSWITNYLGGFKLGESMYYFNSSRENSDVNTAFGKYFAQIDTAAVIYITRFKKPAERFTIFRLKNLTQIPKSELISPFPTKL